ncbi:MAG: hypothetical protein HYR96_03735 [Deltaproteobacteria bacterium]|nr:hypothetical protein [Deltaproteobacteria bacterium]
MDKAAALIAQLLHDLHLYAEVEPLRYSDQAYIWFGRSYVTEKNFESFQTEIVEYLKVLDPKIVTDPETREFYTRIIHSWFRPRLRTQILGE